MVHQLSFYEGRSSSDDELIDWLLSSLSNVDRLSSWAWERRRQPNLTWFELRSEFILLQATIKEPVYVASLARGHGSPQKLTVVLNDDPETITEIDILRALANAGCKVCLKHRRIGGHYTADCSLDNRNNATPQAGVFNKQKPTTFTTPVPPRKSAMIASQPVPKLMLDEPIASLDEI